MILLNLKSKVYWGCRSILASTLGSLSWTQLRTLSIDLKVVLTLDSVQFSFCSLSSCRTGSCTSHSQFWVSSATCNSTLVCLFFDLVIFIKTLTIQVLLSHSGTLFEYFYLISVYVEWTKMHTHMHFKKPHLTTNRLRLQLFVLFQRLNGMEWKNSYEKKIITLN